MSHRWPLRLAWACTCALAAATPAASASPAVAAAVPAPNYAALDHAEAIAAANANFPYALREDPGPALPGTVDRVRGFANDRIALVDTGGHRGLLLSSAPLAAPDASGTLRMLDLGLRASAGAWRPARSLVGLEITADTGAFALTAPGQPTVRVTPLDVPQISSGSLLEDKGFVSNSRVDTDTLLQATPAGVETFEQLRSPDAPTRLRWRVELPEGARAKRMPTGIAFIAASGQPLLVVRAPWAVDAAGKEVPIGLAYDGGVLKLVVHHDDPGVTYPVLADPTWDANYDLRDPGAGTEGFFELDEQAGTPGYELSIDDSGYGAGLFIYPRGGGSYPNPPDGEEVRGSIYFRAPGTTRLKQAVWRGVRYRLDQRTCGPPATFENKRQYLRFTLSLDGVASVDQQTGPDGTHDDLTEVSETGRTITLTDPAATPRGTNASMAMWTDVTGATIPFIAPNPGTGGCRDGLIDPFASAERIDLVLTDVEAPAIRAISGQLIGAAGDIDAAWLSGAEVAAGVPLTGTVDTTDPGSGVSDLAITATNAATGSMRTFRPHDPGALCDPSHMTPGQQGRICPEDDPWVLGDDDPFPLEALGVEEGRWDLAVTVTDRSGQRTSSGAWSYFVDTTPPAVSRLTLTTPPESDDKTGGWIRANLPDQDLEVAMAGTDPPSRTPGGAATGTLSGVRRYTLDFTPAGIATTPLIPSTGVSAEQCGPPSPVAFGAIPAPCPSAGPTQTAVLARDLPEGQATASAAVTDHAGNAAAERDASVWVDNTRPALAATGRVAELDDTWLNPTGTLDLDSTATDTGGSGVARITTRVQRADGRDLEPPDTRQTCPSPNQVAAPSPVCPTTATARAVLAAADLPDGEVRVLVDSEDAVTNQTTDRRGQLDYRLHVDRIAPVVTMSGEAARLADTGYWANPGTTLQATVTATDQGAGLKTLELWARDQDGERRLAAEDVCDPDEPATGDRPPCPLHATADFDISLSDIADGNVRLEARAVEFTGRIARVRDELYLDTTAPGAPRQVTVRRVLGNLATVTWERPPPPPDTSGISMYEYAVIYPGHSEVVWNRTPYQGVQLTGLPDGVDVQVLVRTIDGVGLPSTPASGHGGAVAQAAYSLGCPFPSTYCELIKNFPGNLFPVIGGFVCGEAGSLCKLIPGRDTIRWLTGELISGFVAFGDVRDAIIAVFHGDLSEGVISGIALVPILGDAAKAASVIKKFVKRTKLPLHDVMNAVARAFGQDSAVTRKVLDLVTHGGYGRLRHGSLTHEEVQQLARTGNDIAALSRRARVVRRPPTAEEVRQVEANIASFWPATRRAEALGIESAIQILQREPVDILVSGRPRNGLGSNGPDIVAYNRETKRVIIVEAKGSLSKTNPLSQSRLTTSVGSHGYTQPSLPWLQASRQPGNDFLKLLAKSGTADHKRARDLLLQVIDEERTYDAKIVHVHQALSDVKVYGPKLDRATQLLRSGGGIDDLDIVHVPYPNR